MRKFLIPFAVLAAAAIAQSPVAPPTGGDTGSVNPQKVTPRKPVWRANLPGGMFECGTGSIVSVSSHEYVVEPGTSRVFEVNIDTVGQLSVRIYYIEPAVTAAPGGIGAATFDKVKDLVGEAGERTGTAQVWKNVRKTYPATTHAKTVEYRVGSKASLTKVINSASKSFRTGEQDEVTVSD